MQSLIKLRPFFVSQILLDNTDDNHYITIAEIITILRDKYNIEAYRTTVKSDLDMLIEAGVNIEFIKSSQNRYHIVRRDFDLAEIKILIDAVVSSKFISKSKTEVLSSKLCNLAGPFECNNLIRNIDVEQRIKADSQELLDIIETINLAINLNQKIMFQYFSYNIKKEKKLRHNGEQYIFSPYKLVWNGDYYYVVGFSEKHQCITNFRIDRISKSPKILEEKVNHLPIDFSMNEYLNSNFRMYVGKLEEVELVCDNSVIDAILDKFGDDVTILANDMESFRIIITISISHIFYSWIFGFCGKVKIRRPETIKKRYKEMILNEVNNIS